MLPDGTDRYSAFMPDSKKQDKATLIRAYEAGYRRKPETRREIEAAQAAAIHLLGATEW